jgi:hypothetical protein
MTLKNGVLRNSDIAIIGMSCRLPGAPDIEEFWDLLRTGRSAVARQPDGNWRGVVEGSGGFDAAFFGMTPRQAAAPRRRHRHGSRPPWASSGTDRPRPRRGRPVAGTISRH